MGDTLAALDLGTNSFHLVVARFAGDGHRFEVIERQKEMVRLGSGGDDSVDMRMLEPDAIERGIAALRRCRVLADAHDARLYAVATSAVREAENAEEFLRRARTEAGVDVDVVSGAEEARLIHLGVLQAVPVFDKRLLLVDIGGGSTEVLVGERGEVRAARSFKLGAIRMTRRFFRSEVLHPASVDSCRRHLRAELAPMRREIHGLGFDVSVGSSGTIAAVAAMVHAARGTTEPPRTWNSFEFTRTEVRGVVKQLVDASTIDERRAIPGMDDRRADIILGGALVLEQVMSVFAIDTMVLSDYALREGVLLDAHNREHGGALHHLHDLRRRNVVHLMEVMDDDPAHAERAARLALTLFDGMRPWHELGDDVRELLEAAALLSNVGRFVSHDKHHKHSYYVIRNSDQLTGFTDHEIELIAVMARYHRKSPPKPTHPEFGALRPEDRRVVLVGGALLRVAYALDRTRSGSVQDVRVEASALGEGPTVQVLVRATNGGSSADDLALELFTADERKDMLESALGVEVTFAVEPVAVAV